MKHIIEPIEGNINIDVSASVYEFRRMRELEDRRLYLYGSIDSIDIDDKGLYYDASMTSKLVENIIDFNRLDEGIDPAEREPIRLYIDSPGGELSEGFALVSAMELSKTPVWTFNMGDWCSMAFLIGITGKRRLSLPFVRFLMHEPSGGTIGKISDMEAKIAFDRKFSDYAIREIVLKHSKMSEIEYDAVAHKEFYMLPTEALKYGFIDEIVTDIDTVL